MDLYNLLFHNLPLIFPDKQKIYIGKENPCKTNLYDFCSYNLSFVLGVGEPDVVWPFYWYVEPNRPCQGQYGQ